MTDQPAIDEQGAIIPRYPIQVWLSRGGLLLTGILFVLLQFLGPGKISVETIGDSTVYRSESYLLYFLPFVALILLTLSVVYWLQKGIFYFFSVCLFLMGVCVLFFFFTYSKNKLNLQTIKQRERRVPWKTKTASKMFIHLKYA